MSRTRARVAYSSSGTVFVALVDTRFRPEPAPEPEPRRRRPAVPWRTLGVVSLLVALMVAANHTGGIIAYGLVLLTITVASLAVDHAVGYWGGLTEHRQ